MMKTALLILWIVIYIADVGILAFNSAIVPMFKGTVDRQLTVGQPTNPTGSSSD